MIGLIGDYNEEVLAHRAIQRALAHARAKLGALEWTWVHTTEIDEPRKLERFRALWCVPASPYANTAGALAAIRFARETKRPFLGTCGGFQHALIEWAGSIWGVENPAHAETDPQAIDPIIAPLTCALVEQSGPLNFVPGSRLEAIYGSTTAKETYHCRYGLNPRWAARLSSPDSPLFPCAFDDTGEVRAIELTTHPFYFATLFQPERSPDHPLIEAFARASLEC